MSAVSMLTLARRGTMLVAALIMITLLTVVVSTVVLGGGRDADLTRLRLQSDRARLASSAAAQMAVKEIMDNVDRDSDGAIGTVSNDGNTATDPLIGATRVWATKSVAGSTTTVTARSQADGAAWATNVVISTPASGFPTAANIMFVVMNSASLDAQETAKKNLMQAWGYTVTPISATAAQAAFDAAVLTSSCAYISETVTSTDLGTKLLNAPIGVVDEEAALSDEFGFSASMTTYSDTQVNVTNNTHYITSTFTTGNRVIYTSSQPVRYLSGALGGYTVLARQPATSNDILAVMERGATLTPSGVCAGRRVYLPFGNTGYDVNALNADGQTIMKRSIEWVLMPLAWYKLDEVAGTTASDSSGNAHPGTLVGPTWGAGKVSGAAHLDGADDYITVPNHADFQVTSALTIAGWINGAAWPADSNFASVILRKGDPNPNNWELHVCMGQVKLALDDYDAYGIAGNTVLALNTWYHVAATWDGATVRIYVNGVLDMTPVARAAPIGTDTQPVYVGGRSGSTDVTNGYVDDVRFYSRALTAAEVAALANPTGRPKISSWTSVAP